MAPSRQAAFFGPTVANGAFRTWPELAACPPVAFDTPATAGGHRQKGLASAQAQRNYSYSLGRRLSS